MKVFFRLTFLTLFFASVSLFVTDLSTLTQAQAKSKKKSQKRVRSKNNKKDILDTKFIQKIYKRQDRRLSRINSYKKRGYVGEAVNGLLKLRQQKRLNKKLIIKIQNLIKEENRDREKVYAQISKVNKYNPSQKQVLRYSMFQSRFDLDPPGTYYYRDQYWQKK